MRGGLALAALVAALAAAGSSPASSVTPIQKKALKAVASYPEGRAEVNRAAHLARILPSGRKEHVLVALAEVASFKGRMTAPRALSLIGMLRANDDYFAKHYAPSPKTDITDADGVVYRYFAGRCFEFHPLANFGALNAHVAAKDADATKRLADALVARGVYASGKGVGWEYTFNYAGGHAPWLSGMAQAVAAQAFARAAALVPEEQTQLLRSAHAAFRAIPGRLLTSVSAGPWIRLYSFDSLRVLNAQLQAVVSLQSYASTVDDPEAAALAARMQRAAASTLARFDTGYWSYYALPHEPSPVDYHEFVVQLLKRLGPLDTRFADAAARFTRYEREPPAFKLATAGLGTLRFWMSKPASVAVDTSAGPSKRLWLGAGWHTLSWREPKKPGLYGVHVRARDYAGNATSFETVPFARATASTTVTAPLLVGAALDDPAQVPAGASLVRVGVEWPAGATQPDPGVLASLQQVTLPMVLELVAAPADDTARAQLAQYAAALVGSVASLRELVLAPSATAATAAAYVATLGAIRAALPTTPLAAAVDGNADTPSTLAELAGLPVDAYVFRPAPTGEWSTANVADVASTLASEYGTAVPLYVDGPAPALVGGLSCVPGVTAVLLDHAADLGVRSVQDARRGAVVCPGVSAQVTATTFEPPAEPRAPMRLACDRDCLYLVALERGGKPVAVRRGALQGGKVAAVTLPKVKPKPGAYSVEVRLVAQVNPGAVTSLSAPVG